MTHPCSSDLVQALPKAIEFVRCKVSSDFQPELAMVLGSGLSDLARQVRASVVLPYSEIPGMVSAKVSGHKGEMIFGELNQKKVIVLSGRTHFYEGYPMRETTFSTRLVAGLGTKILILTSAVGAMNPKYRPGDIVVIKDHINFMGTNPLRNTFDLIGEVRFSDMGSCYPKTLQKLALETAKKNRIRAHLGNYFAVIGPSYETPAEIRAFRKLGGDVVGMSLVPEAMTATQIGMQALGLCYASNLAAGISKTALNHKEVLEMGRTAGKRLSLLIGEIVKQI